MGNAQDNVFAEHAIREVKAKIRTLTKVEALHNVELDVDLVMYPVVGGTRFGDHQHWAQVARTSYFVGAAAWPTIQA